VHILPSETDDAVSWLHISDLHFRSGQTYEQDTVLKALIRSLPSLLKRTSRPDFVFVTGDIANSGSAAEYIAATLFFDNLLDVLSLDKNKLFLVPGNHDVDRRLGKGLARTLLSSTEADAYFEPSDPLPHIEQRQAHFSEWFNKYFQGIRTAPINSTCGHPEWHSTVLGDFAILPINSAAFCIDDEDDGKLLVGRRCMNEALSKLADKPSSFRIALMHHPLHWLSQVESSNIKASLREAFDFVLSGHLHETETEHIVGTVGSAFHLAAGATYQTREYPNTAMFCKLTNDGLTVIPVCYVDKPREVWTIDTSLFPDEVSFAKTYPLGSQGSGSSGLSQQGRFAIASALSSSAVERADLEEGLFVTAKDDIIYAEPRLMKRSQQLIGEFGNEEERIPLASMIGSRDSYIIETRSEYGASTLCKRIALEFANLGTPVIRKDARALSNYRKKLEVELSTILNVNSENRVLVLDNFDPERDEKLIRELHASGWFSRVFALNINRGPRPIVLPDFSTSLYMFKSAYLWTLSREDVRGFSALVFDTSDEVFISRIVDKVYSDLLGLRIPLTASNTIMYLKILHREGEFHPLNRVDIVARYIDETLRRPSDAYGVGLNSKNKLDILSSFCHHMYIDGVSSFDSRYWLDFSEKHKSDTLSDYNSGNLLNELVEGKVFVKFGSILFLRYSFYFSYFLGKHLSSRRVLLDEFLVKEEYLSARGVIDVVTGIGSDNTAVLEHLTGKLQLLLQKFEEKYVKIDFDPLAKATWPRSGDEEERLWKPVQRAIEAGPKSVQEIDRVKSSLLAERRSADQEVSFAKFNELEIALFTTESVLIDAFKNSEDVRGTAKLRALEALLSCALVKFQVGTMLASVLARRPFYRWGGVAFVDFNSTIRDLDPDSPEAVTQVVCSLSQAVAGRTADLIGSSRLSAVFSARKLGDSVSFKVVMTFYCILSSRGSNWAETLREIIEKTDRQAFYLSLMLDALMDSLNHEISQSKDRDAMKRLVAFIQAKRSFGKQAPGNKAVSIILGELEKRGDFDSLVNVDDVGE
jgi:predicted phosphodiesterase